MIASETFADTGIRIRWTDGYRNPEDFRVHLLSTGPSELADNVLVVATPQQDKPVNIFYSRIAVHGDMLSAFILGYTIVHELGHVFQGRSRHSASGIMKPHWASNDYFQMRRRSLHFTEEDVRLIHEGLKMRAAGNPAFTAGSNQNTALSNSRFNSFALFRNNSALLDETRMRKQASGS